jgi:hypothetical protein
MRTIAELCGNAEPGPLGLGSETACWLIAAHGKLNGVKQCALVHSFVAVEPSTRGLVFRRQLALH